MHIQIVNFQLNGMSEADYIAACETRFAKLFQGMDGLISKVWLRNPETNTYGGVYTWRDQTAMDAYKRSELFQTVSANPLFANFSSRDFSVLEGLSDSL